MQRRSNVGTDAKQRYVACFFFFFLGYNTTEWLTIILIKEIRRFLLYVSILFTRIQERSQFPLNSLSL